MAFVLPGWWLVTVAQGDPNRTLTILCAVFGFTFIAARGGSRAPELARGSAR